MKPAIVVGDRTDHGGIIEESEHGWKIEGKPAHLSGMQHYCPRCQVRSFAQVNPTSLNIFGRSLVLEGDRASCGARYISSQNLVGVNMEKDQYASASCLSETLELVSETEAILPLPRTRTQIGVGEIVKIKANIEVEWLIDNDLMRITERSSKEIEIEAQDQGGKSTIIAKHKTATTTLTEKISFTIIEPEGINYRLAEYKDYTQGKQGLMLFHPQHGNQGAVGLSIQLLPVTVNFDKVRFRELNSASKDTGYFAMSEVHCHIGRPIYNQCVGAGETGFFKIKNHEPNISTHFDIVGGGEKDPTIDVGRGGSMIVDIPIQWCLGTFIDSGKWHSLGMVHQEFILSRNGKIYISKGNFSYTFMKNSDYPDNSFIEN